jgi:hypothetical protein
MSRNRAKGTTAESAVVDYLRSRGYRGAERRAMRGAKDAGDIAGLPSVVIEIKNHARRELAAWVDEAGRERANDHAHIGVVWHKRRGKGNAGDWFVTMTGAQFVDLLKEAGL